MPRPRKPDTMLVRLPPGLHDIAHAIAGSYNATPKEACTALRCSRAWFDKHIRPTVHHVYVERRWRAAINDVLDGIGGPSIVSGTYYSRPELDAMVAAAKVTRRTRVVYPANHMDPEDVERLLRARRRLAAANTSKEAEEAQDALDEVAWKMHPYMAGAVFAATEGAAMHRRGQWPWESYKSDRGPATFAALEAADAETVASLTGWGDTSEEVARGLWRSGRVRLEIPIPDGTERVMYIPDPCPERAPDIKGLEDFTVTVPAAELPEWYWHEWA